MENADEEILVLRSRADESFDLGIDNLAQGTRQQSNASLQPGANIVAAHQPRCIRINASVLTLAVQLQRLHKGGAPGIGAGFQLVDAIWRTA